MSALDQAWGPTLTRTARNPEFPADLGRSVGAFHKMLHGLVASANQLQGAAYKAILDIERRTSDSQKAWKAAGNHPDDWMEAPENQPLWEAHQAVEVIYRTFDKSWEALPHKFKGYDNELERLLERLPR